MRPNPRQEDIMKRIFLGVALLAGVGCARQPMQLSTGRDLRDARELRMTAIHRDEVPEAVYDFRAQVRRMADGGDDPMHRETIRGMRTMAEAVKTLPGQQVRNVNDIYAKASQLEQSHHSALHSDPTKIALSCAVAALETANKEKPIEGWHARIEIAENAVNAIDDKKPYLQQREMIDRAFIEVSNAFVVGTARTVAVANRALGQTVKTMKVERWAGDRRGESPNIEAACNGPATTVIVERTAGDLVAAFFTFGWYTPVHVRVHCPTRTFDTASR
jgi:hypothetical protein